MTPLTHLNEKVTKITPYLELESPASYIMVTAYHLQKTRQKHKKINVKMIFMETKTVQFTHVETWTRPIFFVLLLECKESLDSCC